MWKGGGKWIKPSNKHKKQKKIKEVNFTSFASALPITTPNTKPEPFLGCVADLLLNIHRIKSIVAKNLGEGRAKQRKVLCFRICNRPNSLETQNEPMLVRQFEQALFCLSTYPSTYQSINLSTLIHFLSYVAIGILICRPGIHLNQLWAASICFYPAVNSVNYIKRAGEVNYSKRTLHRSLITV